MKILGLDLGARRVGVAVADGEIIASLEIIEARDRNKMLAEIMEVCRVEKIEKIVLGLPKSKLGTAEDLVRSFALELNRVISLPIEFVDETLTSKEAERILKGLKINIKSEKYKQEIDRISAKLILEQYLNNENN